MDKQKTIRRNLFLKKIDSPELPDGSQLTFSIQFVINSGELIFLPKARTTGANFNLRENRMRSFQPVDSKGSPTGHPYPVSIDNILFFNDYKIVM